MPLKLKVNLFIIASTKLSSISFEPTENVVQRKYPINLFVVMLSIERYFCVVELDDSNVGKETPTTTENIK